MRINLLPQEYRPQPAVNPVRLIVMIAGSVLSLGAILFALFEMSELQSHKTNINMLDQELAIYESSKAELQKIDQMQQRINKYKKEQKQFEETYQLYLPLITGISASLTSNIWLDEIAVSPDGNVHLKGETLDFAIIGDMLKNLEQLKEFHTCKLQKITEIEDEKDILTTYQFEINLNTGRVQQYAN